MYLNIYIYIYVQEVDLMCIFDEQGWLTRHAHVGLLIGWSNNRFNNLRIISSLEAKQAIRCFKSNADHSTEKSISSREVLKRKLLK